MASKVLAGALGGLGGGMDAFARMLLLQKEFKEKEEERKAEGKHRDFLRQYMQMQEVREREHEKWMETYQTTEATRIAETEKRQAEQWEKMFGLQKFAALRDLLQTGLTGMQTMGTIAATGAETKLREQQIADMERKEATRKAALMMRAKSPGLYDAIVEDDYMGIEGFQPHWLAVMKDPMLLGSLPEGERQAYDKFWRDFAQMRQSFDQNMAIYEQQAMTDPTFDNQLEDAIQFAIDTVQDKNKRKAFAEEWLNLRVEEAQLTSPLTPIPTELSPEAEQSEEVKEAKIETLAKLLGMTKAASEGQEKSAAAKEKREALRPLLQAKSRAIYAPTYHIGSFPKEEQPMSDPLWKYLFVR
jgi:hypothetical protein